MLIPSPQAFAASFAKASPKGIVLVARSSDALAAVRDEIHAIDKRINVLAVPTDLSSPDSVAALWDKVKATFRHADVLVNNAAGLHEGLISDIQEDLWWSDFVSLYRSR